MLPRRVGAAGLPSGFALSGMVLGKNPQRLGAGVDAGPRGGPSQVVCGVGTGLGEILGILLKVELGEIASYFNDKNCD